MTDWSGLDRFLTTDQRDPGCAAVREALHAYAELAASDADAARAQYPQIAAHLRACGPCVDDLDGLLAAIRSAS